MKRTLLSFFALLATILAAAETITSQQALQYAADFFNQADTKGLEIVYTGAGATPSFYAINRKGGGWLLLSADTEAEPVLGYSYDHVFKADAMPRNLSFWLGRVDKQMTKMRADGFKADVEVQNKWRTLGQTLKKAAPVTAGASYLIPTAEWGQDAPYNLMCPVDSKTGLTSVSGCVATAMAIVLHTNGYPLHGSGTLSSYTTRTRGMQVEGYDISTHVYDYANMPSKASDVARASEYQRLQIAQLVHDCGVMVQMDYTSEGSGAYSQDVPQVLRKYMGYSNSSSFQRKDYTSSTTWMANIRKELAAGRPILYSAQDSKGSGGHEFVIDGISTDDKLHVNWGWDGYNNGYYAINLAVGQYEFSSWQDAVFNLVPEQGGSPLPYMLLIDKGIYLSSGSIVPGGEFTLTAEKIANMGGGAYDGVLNVSIMHANGSLTPVSSPLQLNMPGASGSQMYVASPEFSCRMPEKYVFSDRLTVTYTEDGVQKQLPYNESVGVIGDISVVGVDYIECNSQYKQGTAFTPTVMLQSPALRITLYLDNEPVTSSSLKPAVGKHVIKAVVNHTNGSTCVVKKEVNIVK